MRKIFIRKYVIISCVSLFILLLALYKFNNLDVNVTARNKTSSSILTKIKDYQEHVSNKVIVSFVVCNSRFNESLNVIRSILIFTKSPVHFVIFSDNLLRPRFSKTLDHWIHLTENQLSYELHNISFPRKHRKVWMNLFNTCASQRLFIPKLLPYIDSMIYVDTDTLFLGPVEELWHHFTRFNDSQISAMTPEGEDFVGQSWYPRFARHPYYGKYGLNSGVMLMNLTRMREFNWDKYLTPVMLKWKNDIPWGDQDIINIIFHYHSEAVMELSCRYNYRTDQCMYKDECPDATKNGVFILHGSRSVFHNNKQPTFRAIYRAIDEYELGSKPFDLIKNLKKYISETTDTYCGKLEQAFLKYPIKTLNKIMIEQMTE